MINEIDQTNIAPPPSWQTDTFRLYQIEKSRANTEHPLSNFFTGNKYTLKEETKRNNINIRAELINFYETYYSANQMTLAVIAPQPLETIKE